MEFVDFKGMAEWFLEIKENYGYTIVFLLANILWAILHNKSFSIFWKRVKSFVFAEQKNEYYKKTLDELKQALQDERVSCDKQITELRAVIERQQVQIDELRDKEMSLREELATLKERLTKHVGKTSRGSKPNVSNN
jgi:peptidoglycan hydrolase CwlO-like protein